MVKVKNKLRLDNNRKRKTRKDANRCFNIKALKGLCREFGLAFKNESTSGWKTHFAEIITQRKIELR